MEKQRVRERNEHIRSVYKTKKWEKFLIVGQIFMYSSGVFI